MHLFNYAGTYYSAFSLPYLKTIIESRISITINLQKQLIVPAIGICADYMATTVENTEMAVLKSESVFYITPKTECSMQDAYGAIKKAVTVLKAYMCDKLQQSNNTVMQYSLPCMEDLHTEIDMIAKWCNAGSYNKVV